MKVFEVRTPDGRLVRHHHGSLEEAKKAVIAGYLVTGEVLGASADMTGGFLDPCGPGSESLMKTLLDARGDELLAWLASKRIGPGA
jgi:hypothetical protein